MPPTPRSTADQKPVMTDKRVGGLETEPAKVMTLEEVSRYLHVHPSTVYRLLKRREIPAFRIGRDWRVNIGAIFLFRDDFETNPSNGFVAVGQTVLAVSFSRAAVGR